MSKVPSTVGDLIALPIVLQSKALNKDVKHYIYIKAYDPKIPDEEAVRSLFLVNIPVTTTESQLRYLFATQLSAGHVETVHFAEQNGISSHSSSIIATTKPTTREPAKSQTIGKRKRQSQVTAEHIETTMSKYTLPSATPTQFHSTGSTAIVTFLDRASRDLTLRACRKAAKHSSQPIIWSAGLPASKAPPLGLARYQAKRALTFPVRSDLLRSVDEFMTTYSEFEDARARESAKKRAEPDEDGFVTVTRGSKGVVKADEIEAIKAREEAKRKKNVGLDDFYRFQTRERRMEEQGMLERRFKEERERVNEMRRRRQGLVDG